MIAWPTSSLGVERAIFTLLVLVLISAIWIETDAYRYAALLLFAYGAYRYWSVDEKPAIGAVGYLCLAWSLYVGIRYAVVYVLYPDEHMGSSEGIYLFPAIYSTVGFAIFLKPQALAAGIRLFLPISLLMLAATVQIAPAGDREIYEFLFTNNTIHSSVCGGFILFAALNFSAYVWRNDPTGMRRTLTLIAAYATIVLCAIGIYWARSRGVWVAIGSATLAQLAVSVSGRPNGKTAGVGAAMIVALVGFIAVAHADLWTKIGPSFDAAWSIAAEADRSGSMLDAVRDAIASGTVPPNMNARLMLWSNALETWSGNIAFGNGIGWEALFRKAHYGDVGFNLLHNGYFEIAVRYGLLGLAFYAVLFTWSVVQACRAQRCGLIAREAFSLYLVALIFFLTTILTNSNNRLAIGESYMLVAAAFGFFCNFRLQRMRAEMAGSRAAY